MAKDIQVTVNIPNAKNIEKLMSKSLGEIVAARINDLTVEYKRYVLEKALEDINLESRWG